MFIKSIDASSMIKTGEKMFELLNKWVDQVGKKNVVQVIINGHASYKMAGNKYYFYLFPFVHFLCTPGNFPSIYNIYFLLIKKKKNTTSRT